MKGHLVHGNYCSMVLADLHKAFTFIWVVLISMLGVTHDFMGAECHTLGFSRSVWKGVSMILSVNIIPIAI